MKTWLGCAIAVLCLSTGCAWYRQVNGDQIAIVRYDASERAAYGRLYTPPTANDTRSRIVLIAEPAPDVALELKGSIDAAVRGLEGSAVSGEVKADYATKVIDLAKRGQALQVQREAYYRLSEMLANGFITPEQAKPLYEKVLETTLAFGQAELLAQKSQLIEKTRGLTTEELEKYRQLGITLDPK